MIIHPTSTYRATVHDDPKVYMGRKWCLEAESKSFLKIN